MRFSFIAAACLVLPALANSTDLDRAAGKVGEETSEREPVARWVFDELPNAEQAGHVALSSDGPAAPEFPDFADKNSALQFPSSGSLRMDDHPDGRFDFDNGDPITLEAWVNLKELRDNAYVIGKGRTLNPGTARNNQNWALRLRSHQGHHIAVSYRFGDPESIRGYLDGEQA